jgi:hypothetical protein
MKSKSKSAVAIISEILPGSVELDCFSSDSVLPSNFRLTRLVMAAIIDSVEDGVVNAVRLRESLSRIARKPGLAVYDQIPVLTISTT